MVLDLALNTKEVHIWRVDLTADETEIVNCHSLLSPDEVGRASRFYFDIHRRRFIVARGALREILERYASFPARELVFAYGDKGKPELSERFRDSGIKFNLSHSHDIAVLAVTRQFEIGVDVEFMDPGWAKQDIAERFFSTAEIQTLRGLPSHERIDAFYSCWTRKEAYIKACGHGLSVPLHSFDVAFGPGVPAALLQVRTNPEEVKRWRMYSLEVAEPYKAALVVAGTEHILRYQDWKAELLFN